MTEFKKNMARRKKLAEFLDVEGFDLGGCGFSESSLVYKKGAIKNPAVWHVGSVTNNFIKNIDLSKDLNVSDFGFINNRGDWHEL